MRKYSSATLLIKDGTLVTPEGTIEADLLAQGEHIKAIGRGLPVADDTVVVDAGGCYVLPGVIDAHTHIALDTGIYKTPDDWYIGTRAAACGGVTTVLAIFSGSSCLAVSCASGSSPISFAFR